MTRDSMPPAPNVNEEVAALIETLHATEQRLEELTAGEVDSVTDRSGRTFLLRHAQDQLRHSEATKQSAIINSLPAPIALLDAQGLIIMVNEAWRQFGRDNLLQSRDDCIALNYLEICDSAQGDHAPVAGQAAEGIRSVLAGRLKTFSLEYSCHSPLEQRWFLLTVSPLADDRPIGAVVMHVNISERKRSEDELRAASHLLDSIIDNIPTAVQLKSVHNDFRIQMWNKAAEALYGMPRDSAIGRNVHDLWSASDAVRMHASDLELLVDGKLQDFPDRAVPTFDRGIVSAHMRKVALSDASGTVTHLLVIADDITARKSAEARVAYLTRVHAMLSSINTLIVRVTTRDELFREACAIAVEAGGFRMSLIAIVDQGTGRIVPVASTGKDGELLAEIKEVLASGDGARNTMVAKAIKDKEIAVSNDSLNDPRLVFGKRYAEAGVRSMAIFPLIVANVAVGAFTLYASEIEFFHEEELKLLSELAGDIAFAIDHIDKQERLHYLAYYDVLTGLPNRALLHDRLEQATRAARRNACLLAVLFVDLDNFKDINDTLGHSVGDALLCEVANRLVSSVRDTDTVGRLGGDEFSILLPEITSSEDAAMVARKLIESCARPHLIAGHELFVSASIGITLFPDDGVDSEILVRNADTAMYRAKELGRNTYQFFTAQMNRNTQDKLNLEGDLRHALTKGEFLIHYQPKVSCTSGNITGFEALLRWQHPLRGLVGPVEFIPVLEESGLIVAVGEWVLTNACIQAQQWHEAGLGMPSIAVNISGRQIQLADLCETVRVALATSGLSPAFLELELTESQLMKDAEGIIVLLRRLKAMGVKLSVDDFGTGFSSLAYLKRFPIDCLKVDRAFVTDITADTNDVSITRAIITLAHNLKLNVVAEGVETEGQLGLLIANLCDEVQGYYFSRPLPAEEATALLRTGRALDSRMIAGMQRRRTLLLVDDEANVLSSLKRLLRPDGYTILTASGAEQGLELLAIHPVDVVVSDQRMPGMSGIDFLRRIKILHPETVRLVLSGYTDLQAVTEAVNEGAIYKFLTKPWDGAVLRANIKEAFLAKEAAEENRRVASPRLFEDTAAIQSVIDIIPVAIFAKDSASRFVLMNKACEAQWGMRYADLRGTDGSQFFPREQMDLFIAKDREIFERGCLLDFEETFWNAELKQNRFGHTFKKPVFDSGGNPVCLVCVTVDITERRLATDGLLLSEEKLRAMFDMSPLGMARNSMDGAFVEANASFLRLVGYSLDELNCTNYWDLTPASYGDQEARQLQSLQSTGRYGPYEKEYINKRGEHVPVRLNGVMITGSDGEKYIWSIVEDISQMRQLDSQLRIAAAAFESQEAMMITDAQSVILRVNRAFTEITGYSAEDAVGKTPSMLKSGRHDADFYTLMWETINATGGWQGEIWDRRKNGEEYPKWLTISAVKNDLGVVTNYIGAHYDITSRKRAEDRINELAFYDQLTGLPNRTLLLDRLQQNMTASSRHQSYGALLFIDLDHFKALNDTLGHAMGDLLLKQVAQRLAQGVRAGDTVARFGGDEFVVMLAGLSPNKDDAAALGENVGAKILARLNQPYQLNLLAYHSTASIGGALFMGDLVSVDELLKQADLAMYKAKKAGRNAVHFFAQ